MPRSEPRPIRRGRFYLPFPVMGVSRKLSFEQQPPLTTPDSLNVRVVGVGVRDLENNETLRSRGRGGVRPGVGLANGTRIGGLREIGLSDPLEGIPGIDFGRAEVWEAVRRYDGGDVVFWEGEFWRSLEADNVGNEPGPESSKWVLTGVDERRVAMMATMMVVKDQRLQEWTDDFTARRHSPDWILAKGFVPERDDDAGLDWRPRKWPRNGSRFRFDPHPARRGAYLDNWEFPDFVENPYDLRLRIQPWIRNIEEGGNGYDRDQYYGSHYLFALLDESEPDISLNGVYAEFRSTSTFEVYTLRIVEVVNGVRNVLAEESYSDTNEMAKPGTLNLLVSPQRVVGEDGETTVATRLRAAWIPDLDDPDDPIEAPQAEMDVTWPGVAEWDAGETYEAGHWALRGAFIYRSLQDANTGNDPESEPAFWATTEPSIFGRGLEVPPHSGYIGEFEAGREYSNGDIVADTDGEDFQLWESQTDNNTAPLPANDNADWQKVDPDNNSGGRAIMEEFSILFSSRDYQSFENPYAVVVSANGKVYREVDQFFRLDEVKGTSSDDGSPGPVGLAIDPLIKATDRMGVLYIADYGKVFDSRDVPGPGRVFGDVSNFGTLGPWDSEVTYDANDVVTHDGSYWESNAGTNTDNKPAAGSGQWTLLGEVGRVIRLEYTEDMGDFNEQFQLGDLNNLDLASFVVVIRNHTGSIIPGIYGIEKIEDHQITLTRSLNGSGTFDFSVERAPKRYILSQDRLERWEVEEYANGDRKGQVPVGSELVELYNDRLVMAVDNRIYMSRAGDPDDFDYTKDDAEAAFSGEASRAGRIGHPVTALAAHSDDYLVVAAATELWVLRGDPSDGGRLDNISRNIGIVGKSAHCYGPSGELYFMSRDGLYVLQPGAGQFPQPISATVLQDDFRLVGLVVDGSVVDTSGRVQWILAYDVRHRVVQIWGADIVREPGSSPDIEGSDDPRFDPIPRYHFWYSLDTNGFFPMRYPSNAEPMSVCAVNGRWGTESAVLLGCRDGWIRTHRDAYFADNARQPLEFLRDAHLGPFESVEGMPDIAHIDSHVVLGPVSFGLSAYQDVVLNEFTGTLAVGSAPVVWEIRVGPSPEQAFLADPIWDGRFTEGANYNYDPKARGRSLYIVLRGDESDDLADDFPWQMESVEGTILDGGRPLLF